VNRRWLVGGALALLVAGVLVGMYVDDQLQPTEKRGSASEEFLPAEEPRAKPLDKRVPWPTYAFDDQRTHFAAGFNYRPPYRRVWRFDAGDSVEFPPSVGFGKVFVPQQRGDFFALNAKTGRVAWKKDFRRCAASSPTISRRGVVYQAYMDFAKCPQDRRGASGFVIAMRARTGKRIWRFNAGPVESSPLLVKGLLYFGSWDRKVYAVNARTGKRRWSFKTDDQVNTSAAYSRGRIFIATDGGSVYALDARSGKRLWRAKSASRFGSREFFYATPTVAYGRVFIGNTDGTMYTYGAMSGKLLWARPLGTYIYSAAAVWRRTIYVGTYSGDFYALDAATGDTKWKRPAPSAVHAAPIVMNGLVYFATCNGCGTTGVRSVKVGPKGTYILDARTGRRVSKLTTGKFANPVLADDKRVYVVGQSGVAAFVERGRGRRRRDQDRRRSAESRRRDGGRAGGRRDGSAGSRLGDRGRSGGSRDAAR
jgi:outer membrane protein assembly factor BamB